MNEYIFLYRGGERGGSPEEMQKNMQKWVAWLGELQAKGNLRDRGQPLDPATGKVVRGKTITDGPYPESKDLVGGFTLVTAEDLAHAAELAKGCPIHERGGCVEVRTVMKM